MKGSSAVRRRTVCKFRHGAANPQGAIAPGATAALREALLAWFRREQRDLPWRRTRDPYAIWVSEIMLQQTRVDTVVPYYERFLRAFPTPQALAEAELGDVLARWAGLGYYRRARLLHAGARELVREHGGRFPREPGALRAISGIGRYTAGAVASIAFGVRTPLVDGNVARVLARVFALEGDVWKGPIHERVWALAGELVDEGDPGAWNQALMELGATIGTPRAPRCGVCPARAHCRAAERGIAGRIPPPRVRAAPKAWRLACVVLEDGGRVLLAERRAELAFGGLWEPPSVDVPARGSAKAAARALAAALVASAQLHDAGVVRHVLTHRTLEARVLTARVTPRALDAAARGTPPEGYVALRAVRTKELDTLGSSALAKKVLRVATARGR
jgi:A/G-specific adenine glycosylase